METRNMSDVEDALKGVMEMVGDITRLQASVGVGIEKTPNPTLNSGITLRDHIALGLLTRGMPLLEEDNPSAQHEADQYVQMAYDTATCILKAREAWFKRLYNGK
jgi:hypothetical protein